MFIFIDGLNVEKTFGLRLMGVCWLWSGLGTESLGKKQKTVVGEVGEEGNTQEPWTSNVLTDFLGSLSCGFVARFEKF